MVLFNVLNLLVLFSVSFAQNDTFYYGKFPTDFLWGTATASYQIEGGWNVDGKGLNIWDVFTRDPENTEDGSNGDVACDSYNKYEDDIKLMKDLKVHFYRLSISWARVLPNGTTDVVNEAGVQYYKTLIRRLKDENIQPFVTLYHWDLPQSIEDVGGWLNESVVDYFGNYSRFCFERFGEDVKFWFTLNEPWVASYTGYGLGSKAPGKFGPGTYTYIASHNFIKAHARAYHVYDDEFRARQNGTIGVVLNCDWAVPKNESNPDDVAAAERNMQMDLGWFANPIFVNGDYPEVMKTQVGYKSLQQNYTKSRLPEFTAEEKAYIKGTSDFFGLNFYTSNVIEAWESPAWLGPDFSLDKDIYGEKDPSWPGSGSDWLAVTPFGIRKMLNWVKTNYNNPIIYVTENGVSENNATINDPARVYYHKHYINNVLKAIDIDGCNVKGYTLWSLMDNFEWESGYTEKFGITYVNMNDPARPRVPKESFQSYAQIIKNNGFPNPNMTSINL